MHMYVECVFSKMCFALYPLSLYACIFAFRSFFDDFLNILKIEVTRYSVHARQRVYKVPPFLLQTWHMVQNWQLCLLYYTEQAQRLKGTAKPTETKKLTNVYNDGNVIMYCRV